MMFYSIDGIPVPQRTGRLFGYSSPMTNYPLAKFILDNLKPDSVIGWMDFEGGEPPTYEGLMMYARMVLPNYTPALPEINVTMRRAIINLFNSVTLEAKHITAEILQEINKAVETKKQAVSRAYFERNKGKKVFVIDSLGSHFDDFSAFKSQGGVYDLDFSLTKPEKWVEYFMKGARQQYFREGASQ